MQTFQICLWCFKSGIGHIVSHESIKVNPNKIKALVDWPVSKTLKCLPITTNLSKTMVE
jgi:hypothetical protein